MNKGRIKRKVHLTISSSHPKQSTQRCTIHTVREDQQSGQGQGENPVLSESGVQDAVRDVGAVAGAVATDPAAGWHSDDRPGAVADAQLPDTVSGARAAGHVAVHDLQLDRRSAHHFA